MISTRQPAANMHNPRLKLEDCAELSALAFHIQRSLAVRGEAWSFGKSSSFCCGSIGTNRREKAQQ
jgi:hypothetical protein